MLDIINLSDTVTIDNKNNKIFSNLSNISFKVRKGEFLALTGNNRITLNNVLKCIYGEYIPSQGNIFYESRSGKVIDIINSDNVTISSLRKTELGYYSKYLDNVSLLPSIDIITNSLSCTRYDKATSRQKGEEYLTKMEISKNNWGKSPLSFNASEKQRFNILNNIIKRPRLLLLDSPTNCLEPHIKQYVISLIKNLKYQGCTMVGIFNDFETMKKLADRRIDLKTNHCDDVYYTDYKCC